MAGKCGIAEGGGALLRSGAGSTASTVGSAFPRRPAPELLEDGVDTRRALHSVSGAREGAALCSRADAVDQSIGHEFEDVVVTARNNQRREYSGADRIEREPGCPGQPLPHQQANVAAFDVGERAVRLGRSEGAEHAAVDDVRVVVGNELEVFVDGLLSTAGTPRASRRTGGSSTVKDRTRFGAAPAISRATTAPYE